MQAPATISNDDNIDTNDTQQLTDELINSEKTVGDEVIKQDFLKKFSKADKD